MKPEPALISLWGRLLRLLTLVERVDEIAERFRQIVGRVAVIRVTGRAHGLGGDGDHGRADALHQIGKAEGRGIFQHARRGLGVVGGKLHRVAGGNGLGRRQERESAQADHDDGGGRTHREQAAAAPGEAGAGWGFSVCILGSCVRFAGPSNMEDKTASLRVSLHIIKKLKYIKGPAVGSTALPGLPYPQKWPRRPPGSRPKRAPPKEKPCPLPKAASSG